MTCQIRDATHVNECTPLVAAKKPAETYVAVSCSNENEDEPEPDAAQELQTLLQLVYPVVATTALDFIPGFTSIILAGHIESPNTQHYVGAATLSSMFMNITAYSVGLGLTTALDTLCSQAYGAQRYDKIGLYIQAGFMVIATCFVPIFLLNWNSEHFLLRMRQDPEVARLVQSFSRWTLLGVPFVFFHELAQKALQAQNVMRPLVLIAVIGNVVNIVLGYLFAYHTSMGFQGIALGIALSKMVMPLLLAPYFYRRPHLLTQWWHGWNLRKASSHVGIFLRLGIPGMLMVSMEWWAYELLTLMSGVLLNAVTSVSAHAVVVNVNNIIYMVFEGLGVAANIRVGNLLGANAPKQARLSCMVALALTLTVGIAFSTLLYAMRGVIPSLFVNDIEIIKKAASVLAIWAPFEVLDSQNTVLQGVFRGTGKQKRIAAVNAIAFYGVGIPVAALLAFHFELGIEGLWLGFGFGIFVTTSLQFYLLLKCWTWRELADDAQQRTAE